ncbi:MAG: hypothetical protein HY062_07330 [Bacteroidetes bacterium]|nr:hypothetical protein [Bacteroidota bacterium]
METEKALNQKVMAITNLIRDKYPELTEFLNEMPVTIPDEKSPELNLPALKKYYDSLCELLKKYAIDHPAQ